MKYLLKTLLPLSVLAFVTILLFHNVPFDFDASSYMIAIQNFNFAGFAGHIVYFYINWGLWVIFRNIPGMTPIICSAIYCWGVFSCVYLSIFHILKRSHLKINEWTQLALILSSPLLVFYIQETEVMALASLFLLLSYDFFERAITQGKTHLKHLSVVLFVLAFFSHTNVVFFCLYFLLAMLKNKDKPIEYVFLSITGITTSLIVLAYPFFITFEGNGLSLFHWIFVSPNYTLSLKILPIIAWACLTGPIFFLFWANWDNKFLKNNYPILVPIITIFVIYAFMVSSLDYYINQFTSYIPIIMVVYFLNQRNVWFIRNRSITILIIIASLNVGGSMYIFHQKSVSFERIHHFIVKNVPPGSYIYAPHCPNLLRLKDHKHIIVHSSQFVGINPPTEFPDDSTHKKILVSNKHTQIYLLDINNTDSLGVLGTQVSQNILNKVSTSYSNNDQMLWKFIHKPASLGNYMGLYRLRKYP